MGKHSVRLVRAAVLAVASAALLLALSGVEGHAQGRGAAEWTTSSFDAQRSGWLRADARLTKDAVQKGEFAFLWLVVLIYILARGGGKYSVDAKLGREF